MLESLFYKVETPTQEVSCEISQSFKNTFFYRTPPMTTSVPYSLQVRENRTNQKNFMAMYQFSLDAIHYISTSEKDENTTFPT